jgi:PAS domain S-box-containing protein
MATELRKTGISLVGDVPWGTHFCSFYEAKQDLLDILVPYFKSGLENKEFCLWVISNSELLTMEEATAALQQAVPDLDRYLAEGTIELVSHDQWFLNGGAFDLHRVAKRFKEKLDEALARGYVGMRVNGSPAWLQTKDGKGLRQFEEELNELFPKERIIASCTYPLAATRAVDVFDIVRRHRFAIARRNREWEVMETPELMQAKAEIKRLNEELEQRVIERTRELASTNIELLREIAERKHAEALLHAKEQEFRAIVENAPDQIIRYDREFRRTYVNPAVAKAYGLPAEALTGKPIGSVIQDAGLDVKEDELEQIRQRIAAVFDTGKSYEYEISWQIPKTGRRYYSVRLFPELDLNGSVTNVLGIARDITERKQAEDELRRQKEILQQIFDHIPVMINFVDADGRIKLVNREWERTLGWSLEEIRQQNLDIFADCYPDPQYRQRVLRFVAEAEGEWADFKTRVRDGRVIDTTWVRVHLSDGTSIGIGQDITERKRAEEKLNATTEQLRALSAKLQSAREEEGARIARELHDELGSALTSLKWDLEGIDKLCSQADDQTDFSTLRKKIEGMIGLIDATINTVTRISSELRPSILDDLGLAAAIEWQCRQFEAHTGIICQSESVAEHIQLNREEATAVFRIVQEAMTNILRHAKATRIDITMEEEDGEFVLRVRDNGRGITEEDMTGPRSLGLMGMRERVHLVGGKIEITGAPGKGTVLTVRIPIRRGASG